MINLRSALRNMGLAAALLLAACGPAATPPPNSPDPIASATRPAAPPTAAPAPTRAPAVAVPVQPLGAGLPAGTDGLPWWNDTVFYEIFVRSFQDSDGDGIGDFNGLISRLDYLNDGDPTTTADLGVTGLWLMPIHPSPSYHGYDVLDYYAVNPQYGTLDDFRRLLDEAHRRGIRVLIDWVPNHTSSRHPWFQAAQDPASEYRDWYVWSADPPTSQGWHRKGTGEFYYGRFWSEMPDLNYANPAVTEQMRDVARFWLEDVGVDGFRIDAIKHLYEDGTTVEHVDATFAWLREFRPFYKGVNPQALMIGEVWDSSLRVDDYVQGDGLDLAFSFDLAYGFLQSARSGRAAQALLTLEQDLGVFRPGQFAPFLANHDQNRVMSVLRGNVDQARSAAAMLLTAPGAPFLYYGEEIGMLGEKPDELIRAPMQWSAEANAGFTSAAAPWERVNADYAEKNVAAQTADPASLLSLYRDLIRLRSTHAALRVGETYLVEASRPGLYALVRASRSEAVLVLINLGQAPVEDYTLDLAAGPLVGAQQLAPLYGGAPAALLEASPSGGFADFQPLPEVPAYGIYLWQLQPVR